MNKLNQTQGQSYNGNKSQVGVAASQLLNESKKFAHEIYEDNMEKVGNVQESLKEYSQEVTQKIKNKPMMALLLAAGAGFLLSALFKK